MVLAGLLLGALDAATAHTAPPGLVRNLVRWPARARDRWLLALGVLWLAIAWFGAAPPAQGHAPEALRALRVAGAALAWSLVAGARLAASPAQRSGDTLQAIALRRSAWLALFGGLLWLWKAGA